MRGCRGLRFSAFLLTLLLLEGPLACKSLNGTSITFSCYPTQRELAKSVLHKGGDNGECGNYRLLTMLSIPGKISESIICDTIDPH